MGRACTSRVPPSSAVQKRGRARPLDRACPPFQMPASRPCCTRSFVGKRSHSGGGAPSYSTRGRRKRGEGWTLRERRAFPLHGLPLAHHREGGVSTTPHVVPRARPLRAPPFACHPAHAVPRAGRRRVAPERWGAGVMHAGRTRDARGVVLTRNAEGRSLPFGAPRFACPRVLRGPFARARGQGEREGAFPCGPCGTPTRE